MEELKMITIYKIIKWLITFVYIFKHVIFIILMYVIYDIYFIFYDNNIVLLLHSIRTILSITHYIRYIYVQTYNLLKSFLSS
jgi:hypothetical protein